MNEYEVKIVNALLKKYYRRKVMHKDAKVNRRIDLTINKILKNYSDYNVDLEKKEHVNKAIESLENRSYIVSLKLKFSEDYEKIYLNLDNINKLEELLKPYNIDLINFFNRVLAKTQNKQTQF